MESFSSFKRRLNSGRYVSITNFGASKTPEVRCIVKTQTNGIWTARPLSLYPPDIAKRYQEDKLITVNGVPCVKVFFEFPKARTVRVQGDVLECLSYKETLSFGEVVNAPFNGIPEGNVWLRMELMNF